MCYENINYFYHPSFLIYEARAPLEVWCLVVNEVNLLSDFNSPRKAIWPIIIFQSLPEWLSVEMAVPKKALYIFTHTHTKAFGQRRKNSPLTVSKHVPVIVEGLWIAVSPPSSQIRHFLPENIHSFLPLYQCVKQNCNILWTGIAARKVSRHC